jgi:hypothetical protein
MTSGTLSQGSVASRASAAEGRTTPAVDVERDKAHKSSVATASTAQTA